MTGGSPSLYGRSALADAIRALIELTEDGGTGGLIVEGPIGAGRGAVRTLLHRVAADAGVVVDDAAPEPGGRRGLVWLGDVAADAVVATARPVVGRPGTGWVLTAPLRDGAGEPPDLGLVTRVRLRNLSRAETLAMATDRLGRSPSARQRVRVDATDGWPVLVASTLGGSERRPGLADAMLSECTPLARDVARVAASLTEVVRGTTLGVVTGLSPARLLEATDELLVGGLMVDDGQGGLAFGSSQLRALIASTVPPGRRRQLRIEALRASTRPGSVDAAVVADLAALLARGRTRLEADVRPVLLGAVTALSPADPATAGRLAATLARATPTPDPGRVDLMIRAVELLGAAGETDEALAAYRWAGEAASTDPQRRAVSATICGAPWAPIDDRIADAADAAAAPWGHSTDVELNDRRALDRLLAGYPAEPSAASTAGRIARAVQATADGAFSDALERLDEAHLASGSADAPSRDAHLIAMWRCEALMALDRFDEAARVIDASRSLAGEHAFGWAQAIWPLFRGRLAAQRGRLDEAADDLAQAASGAPPHAIALYAAGEVALRRGQPAEVIRRATRYASATGGGLHPEPMRHAAWFQVIRRGETGADLPPSSAWALPRLGRDPLAEVALVRFALAADDRSLAARAAAEAERRATVNPSAPSLAAAAIHARALLERDRGALAEVVRIVAGGERRLVHADALADLAAHAEPAAEVGLLDEALVRYVECGARRDADRVRRRLGELGVRRRVRLRTRPDRGWAALTPGEVAVVRVVASGLTKRAAAEQLTLSPHTINAHLRRSYLKLGVASRVELARVVLEQDARPGDTSQA